MTTEACREGGREMQKTETKPRGTEQTSQDDVENEHRTEDREFLWRKKRQATTEEETAA